MLQWIVPYISVGDGRALPAYQTFLQSQTELVRQKAKRLYLGIGHESPGVRLLRAVLSRADLPYLRSLSNNYDRYRYHLSTITDSLTDIFDHSDSGRAHRNCFFRSDQFTTDEFIIPTEDDRTFTTLPIASETWEDWRKVRPLHLWSYNSDELSLHLLNDRLRFTAMPPSRAIILLDIVALVFKYYVWDTTQRFNEPESARELVDKIPQQYFLHKYVIVPLVWDILDQWLVQQLGKLAAVDDPTQLDEFSASQLEYSKQYGPVSLHCARGFAELWHLLADSRGSTHPSYIFNCKLLSSGSIHNRILAAEDGRLSIPITLRYMWQRWLRDRDLFWLYVRVFARRPDLPTTKSLLRHLSREMKRCINVRPWNQCRDTLLRDEIESDMRSADVFLSMYVSS